MSVSVIIPAYNEENAIAEVIRRIQALPIETEIIVVNDGSTDATANIARDLGVVLIDRPGNIGYGKSLKEGITIASFDTVVITDADGTYPIEQIPMLVVEYRRGFDMVVGARQGVHYWSSPLKSFFRFILRKLCEFVSGRPIPDINSGLRVFSKQTALLYQHDLCDTFSFTTTITLIYFLTKHTIFYVPIEYKERIGSSKVQHIRDALRTTQYIIECIITYNPIKLFLLLTILTMFIGAISSIVLGWIGITLGLFTSIIVFSMGLSLHSKRTR